MNDQERELNAHQFKDRYDLNEQQANRWGKFLKRKEEYAQRYGAAYADVLLKVDREALEARNDQEHKDLNQHHDQQWLDHHDSDTPTRTYNLPEYLRERELQGSPAEVKEKDITAGAATILERYQQTERTTDTLFQNPFKKNIEQENAHLHQTKDIDQSQEYMNTLLTAQQKAPEKEKSDTANRAPVSMSTRFSQGLSYTKAKDTIDTPSDPGKDMDRE